MFPSGTILRRAAGAALVLATALALSACGSLAGALPPRPSPYPTLPRLPSVTPITPRPTAPPSATPTAVPATPTATPLLARVAVAANMRSGPGLEFAVVSVVEAGVSVSLEQRQGDWYQIRSPAGLLGWMFVSVLDIDPAIAEAVPAAP